MTTKFAKHAKIHIIELLIAKSLSMLQVNAAQEQENHTPDQPAKSASTPLKSAIQKISALSLALTLPSTALAEESKATETDKKSPVTVKVDPLKEYEQKIVVLNREDLLAEIARLTVFTGDKSLPFKERKYYSRYKGVCMDELDKRTAAMKQQADTLEKNNDELEKKNDATEDRIAKLESLTEALLELKESQASK